MKCGCCKGNHQTVAEVKDCYAMSEEGAAQAAAELAAEQAVERWFEERGGAEDDPRERDLWAQEDLMRETLEIQRREREDDERAYAAKARRDEELMAAEKLDRLTGAPGRDMASEKQIKYAVDLLRDRVWPDVISEDDLRNMERRQVTKLINGLVSAPRKPKEQRSEPEPGMYRLEGGDIVRVYLGQQSGHMLAKKLVEGNEEGSWVYQYVGAARKLVGRLTPLTLEEAKQWGRMSSTCCVCARRLDVPESVDAGIGPDCASKIA